MTSEREIGNIENMCHVSVSAVCVSYNVSAVCVHLLQNIWFLELPVAIFLLRPVFRLTGPGSLIAHTGEAFKAQIGRYHKVETLVECGLEMLQISGDRCNYSASHRGSQLGPVYGLE